MENDTKVSTLSDLSNAIDTAMNCDYTIHEANRIKYKIDVNEQAKDVARAF